SKPPLAPEVKQRCRTAKARCGRCTCSGIPSFYLEFSFGNSTHNFEVYVVDDQNGGTQLRSEELQVLDGTPMPSSTTPDPSPTSPEACTTSGALQAT
ncbi:MAG: hypothetical protein ACRDHZ_22035, partial [Ktedonobacteraceae bacterium]